jgi:hypothetical protein
MPPQLGGGFPLPDPEGGVPELPEFEVEFAGALVATEQPATHTRAERSTGRIAPRKWHFRSFFI